jgi:predicted nucleotidyltransferase
MISTSQQNVIKQTAEKLNPSLIAVFGSYARGEQDSESDLDLLIDFNSQVNLLDIIGLEQELSEILGIKVDLITLNSVNNRLKPYIQKDLIRIL